MTELNLNYKFNPIYWQTANLVVDSGSYNQSVNDSTDYGKMAVAIALIQMAGVQVEHPDINRSKFGFTPDVKNNGILFGFKGVNSVNSELANMIVRGQPYTSMDNFMDIVQPQPKQMLELIKGGCFDDLTGLTTHDNMEMYLKQFQFKPVKVTMRQLSQAQEMGIIPDKVDLALRMYNFKNYVLDDEGLYKTVIEPNKKVPKRGYHDRWFVLDGNSQPFFERYFDESCVETTSGSFYVISEKKFIKLVDVQITPLKEWLSEPSTGVLFNARKFDQLMQEKAAGSVSAWSMESLSYYSEEHELVGVDNATYGFINFFDLPRDPHPYTWYRRKVNGVYQNFPKYTIYRIAGTVIKADNNHYMVSLATPYGMVNVKFPKTKYAYFNQRLSEYDPETGKKHVTDNSWFKKGSMIAVTGIRSGDMFIVKRYQDTIYQHTVVKIKQVNKDGSLEMQTERTGVEDDRREGNY